MTLNVEELGKWLAVVQVLRELGVSSWTAIGALLHEAGHDEEALAALQTQWDILAADVKKSAGLSD